MNPIILLIAHLATSQLYVMNAGVGGKIGSPQFEAAVITKYAISYGHLDSHGHTVTPYGEFLVTSVNGLDASAGNAKYGPWFIRLSHKYPTGLWLGIHGTDHPELIGKPVSDGCLRLRNEDLADLVQRVPVGTKVYIE